MIFLKLMLLPMLLKVLDKTGRPFVCSTLYAVALLTNGMIFDLALGAEWTSVLLAFAIAFGASSVFFFVLHILDGTGGPYWFALAVGLVALLMI